LCLEEEKSKTNGNYECGDTLFRLQQDFHYKCYICEKPNLTDIQIDHFLPRKLRPDLRCEWTNLFLCCVHCNNTKLAGYIPLLDCTKADAQIAQKIRCTAEPMSQEVCIEALSDEIEVANTVRLLRDVYFGKTSHKAHEAVVLRRLLYEELTRFTGILQKYLVAAPVRKPRHREQIVKDLQPTSAFTSFKIWVIWQHERLRSDFVPDIPPELQPPLIT
jgi:hypothetical protein